MDSFELNKIMAAILIALLVAMIACLFGDAVVVSEKLLKNVYVVDTQEDSSAVAANQEKSLTVIEPMLASADVINGEKAFKKCLSCHTVGKGEPHKTGPNLWNIVMGYIASDQTFAYSDALRSKKEQWSYENLNKFLYKPREFAPGTKMTFIGISNDQERADLIAFLRKNADNPAPLP